MEGFIVVLLTYGLGLLIVCVIGYHVIRAAVRDGVLQADAEREAKRGKPVTPLPPE